MSFALFSLAACTLITDLQIDDKVGTGVAEGADDTSGTGDSDSADTDDSAEPDTDDTDTHEEPPDEDGDGFSVRDGDCDDSDAAVSPAADEVCNNGKDDDCDGGADACRLAGRSLAEADAEFAGAGADALVCTVAAAGDVNGDGFDDALVGSAGAAGRAGTVTLLLGSSAPASTSLAGQITFSGEATGDGAINAVAAGDVDGDGLPDIFIGAGGNDAGGVDAGASYLIPGGRSTSSRTLGDAPLWSYVGERPGDSAGLVGAPGDVDGDGLADLLVGSPRSDQAGDDAGAAYLVLGTAGPESASLSTAIAFVGAADADMAGTWVAGAGDVDGDGTPDVLVAGHGSAAAEGSAYILLGRSGLASQSLADADTVLTGVAGSDFAGYPSRSAGDLNGDGLGDLAFGAYGAGPEYEGAVYVFFGSGALPSGSFSSADLVIEGVVTSDNFGLSVAGTGDTDGDGLDDLLIGARSHDHDASDQGSAFLFFGGLAPGSLTAADAGAKFWGEGEGDLAGSSVAGALDFDNDGLSDLLVSSYSNDDGGDAAGAAYLILGSGI